MGKLLVKASPIQTKLLYISRNAFNAPFDWSTPHIFFFHDTTTTLHY